MGGQACILYGGAEFSRDVDFAVAVSPDNLRRLQGALRDQNAEPVFFPPLSAAVLKRGHACHFRCGAPATRGLRVERGPVETAAKHGGILAIHVEDGDLVSGVKEYGRFPVTRSDACPMFVRLSGPSSRG